MKQNANKMWALLVVLALSVPALWAQRVNPVGPAAPIGEDEESSSKQLDEPVKDAPVPDDRPLGGAETFSLGKLAEGRKFFRYSLNFSQRLDNNTGSFRGASHLGGSFELRRSLRNSDLIAKYEGGGILNTHESNLNSSFHQLAVRQSWRKGRWGFLLGDQVSYAPDSPYSLAMAGHFLSVVFDIGGESTINRLFIPGQGFVAGNTTRFGNTTLAQVRYLLGPRTSVFAAGGYGFLNFSDPNFTDLTQRNGVVGFERGLGRGGSLGVNYGFSQFHFSGQASTVKAHSIRLAYGRRVTDRMALQLQGGPEIGMFVDPVLGPTTRLSWTVDGSLQYLRGRSNLGLNYRHALDGGSGVLAGSANDTIGLSWQRRLTPRWDLSVNGGYARNESLRTLITQRESSSYAAVLAGVSLNRRLSSERSLSIGYHASRQVGPSGCGGSCGLPLRHSIEVGFTWSPREHHID